MIRATSWPRMIAYIRAMPKLNAEEGLTWIARIHPGKELEKLYNMLRKAAGYVSQKMQDSSLITFMTDPLLSRNVIVRKKE